MKAEKEVKRKIYKQLGENEKEGEHHSFENKITQKKKKKKRNASC